MKKPEEVQMSERRLLGRLAREPLYNTRAVANATNVPIDTLRAWERRYDVPRPFRTPSNQRLYSEQDIGIINWLRERTDEGMTISQAVKRLHLELPDLYAAQQPVPTRPIQPADTAASETQHLQQRLLDAAIAFDSANVGRCIDDGLARFSVEAFIALLVEPIAATLDEVWGHDALHLAARSFLERALGDRLSALSRLSTPQEQRKSAILLSADEQDVMGRALEVIMARNGWRVVVLGADLSSDAIVTAVQAIEPTVVCLRAPSHTSLNLARAYAHVIRSTVDPLPSIVIWTDKGEDIVRPAHGFQIMTGTATAVALRIGEFVAAVAR